AQESSRALERLAHFGPRVVETEPTHAERRRQRVDARELVGVAGDEERVLHARSGLHQLRRGQIGEVDQQTRREILEAAAAIGLELDRRDELERRRADVELAAGL